MAEPFQEFVATLGAQKRVVLLGGLAVIAHGLSRPTKDVDIWLEPLADENAWAEALMSAVEAFQGAEVISLLTRAALSRADLPEVIQNDRVVRIQGLNVDINVFRIPNNLETEDFDPVWERATQWDNEVRVIDPLDLLVTKSETGRVIDQQDISFLEGLVRREFGERLAIADPEEARALFERYADYAVCEKALGNPHPEVREMARQLLAEFAEGGDPFASDLLRDQGK